MSSSSPAVLPSAWTWTTLGEVTETGVDQGGPPGSNEFLYVDIGSIDNRTKQILTARTLRVADTPSRARQRLEPYDVLVSMTRPNLNAVALLPPTMTGSIGSTGFHVLRTRWIEPKWLFYLVQTTDFVHAMSRLVQGALYPAVRPKDIVSCGIPLAPLPEQRRIVAEIEKQVTRLDAAVAALERVLANLRRYRAAVLKAACEGRLVPTEAELARAEGRDYEPAEKLLVRILAERRARWEADQLARMQATGKVPKDDKWKTRYQEPAQADASKLPGLPEGWVWTTPSHVSWDCGYGTSQRCAYEAAGPAVLRIPNVVSGRLDLTDLKFATSSRDLQEGGALEPADLLVIRTNGSRDLIGRGALVREALKKPHFFASYLIRFRLVDLGELPEWLVSVWDARQVRARIEASAATSAGQYNVTLKSLAELPIPMPPAAEQQRIVAECERRFSVAEELMATVEANIRRAERLRQAILRRAFGGKLAPQDPNDEPATELLARIRSERMGQEATKPASREARQRRARVTPARSVRARSRR